MRSSPKFLIFVFSLVTYFGAGEAFALDRYQRFTDGLADSMPKLPGNEKIKEHYLSPKINYIRSDFSDSFKEQATLESSRQSFVSFGIDYCWLHPRTRNRLLWLESNIAFHNFNDQMSNARTEVPPTWNVEVAPINIKLLWPYLYFSGEYESDRFLSFDKEKHILVVADASAFEVKKVELGWLNAGVFFPLIPGFISFDFYGGKSVHGHSRLKSAVEQTSLSGRKFGARFRHVLYRDGLWYSIQYSKMHFQDDYTWDKSTLVISLGHIF
jgi:hypothetical protein